MPVSVHSQHLQGITLNVDAVSYTHLDVYKRQVYNISMISDMWLRHWFVDLVTISLIEKYKILITF